ncbi:hypothetical protein ACFV0O_38805 [Kitasatospora sp. NPDC059577]|uniref:hypothetical protein n=1 Tax=Kitasatospora sp. NPDC059577 TaxID=3346873 RepID=UPI0036B7F817
MPRAICHFPITVSLGPDPTAEDLERLEQAVVKQLTERLAEARWQLELGLAGPWQAVGPVGRRAEENADPDWIGASGTVHQVPSYDAGGAPRPVRVQAAPPSGRPTTQLPADRPFDITASYAGGPYGEHDLPFELGRRGMRMLITSSGRGADVAAFDPSNGEVWVIDNKAIGARAKLRGEDTTALGTNLGTSLEEIETLVRGMPDFPERAGILRRLEGASAAVRAGKPIPDGLGIWLKLTNAGGYGHRARILPPQVEPEDVVGPEVRAQRKRDEAEARAEGGRRNEAVSTGRPRSHEETTAVRERVGGVRSREPVPGGRAADSPPPLPGSQLGRRLRVLGGEVLVLAGLFAWEMLMTKLEWAIEDAWLRPRAERRMRELEPVVTARLDALIDDLAEIQLSHPGNPLYGVIGLLTILHRAPGEDEAPIGLTIELTSVSVGTEKVDRTEHSRTWVGSWLTARAPEDHTQWTFSIELDPLSGPELRDHLLRRIAAEAFEAGSSSATPRELLASRHRRDELLRRLTEWGGP